MKDDASVSQNRVAVVIPLGHKEMLITFLEFLLIAFQNKRLLNFDLVFDLQFFKSLSDFS